MNKFITELEEIHPGLFGKTIGYESLVYKVQDHHYLCLTCEKYIFKGELPPMSNQNKLQIFNENHPKYLNEYEYLKSLSELENCMIAQNILFMKMFALPKSQMSAFKDRLVNITISINDVSNTIKSLPRTPSEAGIVFIKFKRKHNFKNTHIQEFVSVPNLKKAIIDLRNLGHKYYKDFNVDDVDSFELRCENDDPEGREFLFGLQNESSTADT